MDQSAQAIDESSSAAPRKRRKRIPPVPMGTCDQCGKTMRKYNLNNHFKICNNPNKPYKCKRKSCEKRFKTKYELAAHKKVVHVRPIICPMEGCGTKLKSASLYKHIVTIHDKVRVACPDCGRMTSTAAASQHRKICQVGDVRNFHCTADPDCKKSFRSGGDLRCHIRAVHGGTVRCPREGCGEVVKKHSLAIHLRHVHENVRVLCENCGKRITYTNFSQHRKTCLAGNSRDFRCQEEDCYSAFRTDVELKNHVRNIHCPDVLCPREGCGTWVRRSYLSQHIKIVHERRMMTCKCCQKQIRVTNHTKHLKICKGIE